MLDRRWDVIIIGGGIVGCATAYYAVREGMSALVVERDAIGSAQSGRNLGFVRQQGRDFRELDLMIKAMRLWEGLEHELGRSVGWCQGGNVSLAMSEADLESRREWQRQARDYGLDTRILTASQTCETVPHLARDAGIVGSMYTPSDGKAEPSRATRAFFDAAILHGADVMLGHAVSAIETAAGRAEGVRVGGKLLRADTVICAAGAGSTALLRRLGVFLPQDKIRATVARTKSVHQVIIPCVSGPSTGIRQSADGTIHMSVAGGEYDVRIDSLRYARWFAPVRRENPDAARINYLAPFRHLRGQAAPPQIADIAPTRDCVPPEPKRIMEAHAEFCGLFPLLAGVELEASWAGYIDTLPDIVPAIGPVDAVGGLLLATGFSGHGFGPAPMAGRAVVNLLLGRPAGADISALSPERFSKRVR